MYTSAVPTDQRAGARPISFLLDTGGGPGAPVTLKIRPEDLSRNEPSRITVHQTLGRETSGWVDNFGEGLPSVTISGHTGWRPTGVSAEDGFRAFERLNQLVVHDYHAAKQAAIDSGRDPASVKLLFVDMLDGFAWNVAPMSFVLKRSKSRPLLIQYNINLQAVSTSIDTPFMDVPFFGSIFSGLGALGRAINTLLGFAGQVQGWVGAAVSVVNGALAPIATTVRQFALLSTAAFGAVQSMIAAVGNGIGSIANTAIGIARDIATVGVNVFRTFSVIAGLPGTVKAALSRVAGAYNEILCLFSNSLRKRKTYQNFEGLYGASNCSSTTGGRPGSAYVNENAFALIQPQQPMLSLSTAAMSSTASLSRTDPVLAPMPLAEMDRHLNIIVNGLKVQQ